MDLHVWRIRFAWVSFAALCLVLWAGSEAFALTGGDFSVSIDLPPAPPQTPVNDGRWYGQANTWLSEESSNSAWIRRTRDPLQYEGGTSWTGGYGKLHFDGRDAESTVMNQNATSYMAVAVRHFYAPMPIANVLSLTYYGTFVYKSQPDAESEYNQHESADRHEVVIPAAFGLGSTTVTKRNLTLAGSAYARAGGMAALGATTTTGNETTLYSDGSGWFNVQYVYDLRRDNLTSSVWHVTRYVRAWGKGVSIGGTSLMQQTDYTFAGIPQFDTGTAPYLHPSSGTLGLSRGLMDITGANANSPTLVLGNRHAGSWMYGYSSALAAVNRDVSTVPSLPVESDVPANADDLEYDMDQFFNGGSSTNPSGTAGSGGANLATPDANMMAYVQDTLKGWTDKLGGIFEPLKLFKKFMDGGD